VFADEDGGEVPLAPAVPEGLTPAGAVTSEPEGPVAGLLELELEPLWNGTTPWVDAAKGIDVEDVGPNGATTSG